MTAVLDEPQADSTSDSNGRGSYPERLSVRLSRGDYHLYDALEDTAEDQDVTSSHIVLALLQRWQQDPDMQASILEEARKIGERKRTEANKQRSLKSQGRSLRNRRRQRQADP